MSATLQFEGIFYKTWLQKKTEGLFNQSVHRENDQAKLGGLVLDQKSVAFTGKLLI